ncbi:MAG: cytochrome c3 family protein [Coriobacteriia bacterium]
MADLMRRTLVAGALALALAAGAPGAAHAAKPTKPSLHEAFPSGSNQVTLRWERSTDASATHTITYEIYRSKVPIQQSMITPGLSPLVSVVTPVSLTSAEPTWTAVVAADVAGGEAADVYVWFYAVRARDSAGVFSDISPTLAPNLHGGRGDANVATCQRCHKIHGSLTPGVIDRSSWTCYHCHGRADGSSSGPGDRSTINAKADFYDYGNLPAGGSQHRSAKMTATNQQCRACHTPHRASYFFFTTDGTSVLYDALRSFRKMLRVQTGLSATSKPTYAGGYYGRNDNTAEDTSFCLSCHGSATASPADGSAEANMGYVSDGGYAATGGDHNEAGYATAIHGPGVIFSNDRGRAREGDFPQIQCLACHDKHASAADKLIAYRGQDTTATASGTYARAELCFACHAAGSTENKVAAGYTAPFSWNSRDVKAQFAKASRHPTATSGGRWVAKTGTVFSQTTQAEFAANTLFQTSTALVPGSVVLAQYTATIDPPAETYLFGHDGGTQAFDQYRPADNAWNASNYGRFDPPDNGSFSTATGSQTFSAGGRVFVTRGGNSTTSPMIRQYTPPANSGNGTWANAAITAFSNPFNTGAQAAVHAPNSVVYITQGGNSSRINWWQYSGTSTNDFNFSQSLGAGSGLAYAGTANRLFVLYRNGGTGDGVLYYTSSPGTPNGGTPTWTSTSRQLTSNSTTTYHNRLAVFRDGGGTEYLMMVGADTGGSNDTVIVGSLGGTVSTPTFLNIAPFAGALADGCDLKWDGVNGGYLYAIRGGANAAMARIRIPAASALTAGNWGTWETLTNTPWTQDAGAGIAFATADPPPYSGLAYHNSGTVTTGDITTSGRPTAWGTLSWTEVEPVNTALSVTVQGWNGTSWVNLVTGATSPVDLSGHSATTYTKLRLVGNLTTSDTASTPRLDDWTVTGSWEEYESGEYVSGSTTVFSQTTQAEFAANTLFQTSTALVPGSVVLAQYTATIDPPAETYLFGHDGGTQAFDQYRPADNAWNASNYGRFDPPDNGSFSTATGSQTFSAGGRVFVTRGGNSTTSPMIRQYTPPANSGNGTWANAAITAFSNPFNTGAQAAVHAPNSVVYITQGGNSSRINWWQYSGTSTNDFNFSQSLGAGSGLAYAGTANRLFVLYRNGGTGDGVLYYTSSPGTPNGGTPTWTSTSRQLTSNSTTTYHNRLAVFRDGGGTEYLMMVGADTGGSNDTVIVGSLGGTVSTPTFLNIAPFAGALADGCDLKWDGVNGGYLYAIRGGANAAMARIRIPAASALTAGNWGTWETLTNTPWTQDAGAGIAFATADPPPYSGLAYHNSGTVTTGDITTSGRPTAWGTLSWTEVEPVNTALSVTVQGWNGTSWVNLVTGATSPVDLSGHSATTYTRLRLVGNLTTSDTGSTPRLDDWTVASLAPMWVSRGSLTCASCHNVHYVRRGSTTAGWDMARVSSPSNTKLAYTGTTTEFCLECHDGAPPTATTNASTIVPYSVGFRIFGAGQAPFFTGWNKKTASGAEFVNSAHATTVGQKAQCKNCHDPHASNFPRLTAWTAPAGTEIVGAWTPNAGVRANETASLSQEQNLCYQCHGNGTVGRTATGADDLATPFAAAYRHPVERTGGVNYPTTHSSEESGAALGSTNRHAECVDCHDPHAARRGLHTAGNSAAGPALQGAVGIKPTSWPANWTAVPASAWQPERMTGETTDFEAYLCFKCHSSYSGQPFTVTSGSGTYTSTDVAMEFNPSNQSEHNVLGQRVVMETAFTIGGTSYTWAKPASDGSWLRTGWTSDSMMTCTDCHSNTTASAKGPHGSTARWLIDPAYPVSWNHTGGTDTTTPQLNRNSTTGMSLTRSGTSAAGIICEKCHGVQSLATVPSNAHSEHDGRGAKGGYCRHCHVGVPHGWKRPRLIGYTTDPEPYRTWGTQNGPGTGTYGLTKIALKSYTSTTSWVAADCYATCYGSHANMTTSWP